MKRATPYLMFPGNSFGSCIDRFGVRWMVDDEGTVDFGMPCVREGDTRGQAHLLDDHLARRLREG